MFVFLCCFCVLLQISICMKVDINSATMRNRDNSNTTEIRCYCNLPMCITTSYMCKSEGLGCFSDILAHTDVNKASHGCLDLLDRERQDQCQNEPSSRSIADPRSLLLCCDRDLCNHVDSPETRQRYNDTVLASSLMTADSERIPVVVNPRLRPSTAGYSSAEVWFRAATIAVPFCGALILLVLIALAVRILQSDAMDDRVFAAKLRAKQSGFSAVNLNRPTFVHQLHDPDNDTLSPKKMPLLFQHESSNTTMSSVPFTGCMNRPASHGQVVNVLHSCQQRHKNETNAKMNLSQNGAETQTPVPVIPVHTPSTPAQVETPGLIDLQKLTSPCNNNCNIFLHEDSPEDFHSACALLPSLPPTNHKLTYKKPLGISWTDSDTKGSNSQ